MDRHQEETLVRKEREGRGGRRFRLFLLLSSHAVTADLGISDLTKAAEFFCSDGIIVTGSETGSPADGEDVTEAREATQLPLVIGSGVTEANMKEYHGKADVLIVGSHFKVGGRWHDDVDEDRVRNFMTKHKQV